MDEENPQPKKVHQSTKVENFEDGFIQQEFSSYRKECLTKGTNYRVRFPKEATVDQKTLLIAAAMMIDMNY